MDPSECEDDHRIGLQYLGVKMLFIPATDDRDQPKCIYELSAHSRGIEHY